MTQRRSIMKSVIELEINAPQDRVAELFDNPRMFPRWMDDVDRVEPLSNTSYLSLGADFRIVRRLTPTRSVSEGPPSSLAHATGWCIPATPTGNTRE